MTRMTAAADCLEAALFAAPPTRGTDVWESAGFQLPRGESGRHRIDMIAGRIAGLFAATETLASLCGAQIRLRRGLLGRRSGVRPLVCGDRTSCGGSARMIETADGWIAVSITRDDDLDLLPAWLGDPNVRSIDDAVSIARLKGCGDLVEMGRLLGLAISPVRKGNEDLPSGSPVTVHRLADPVPGLEPVGLRVVNLASLWAGPLCGRLLVEAGANVTRVESRARPDTGDPQFADAQRWLDEGQERLSIDFGTHEGAAKLKALIADADIVIEGSRPRALRQLGIDAEAMIAARPGKIWISITAYGRADPCGQWIGFGDDAAAAAGLVAYVEDGGPLFMGDALADPLTGLMAAAAGFAAIRSGGGCLLDVSLYRSAAFAAG